MGQIANRPSSWSADTESFILSSEQRPNPSAASNSDNEDVPVISLTPLFDALGAELATGSDWSAIAAAVTEVPALRALAAAIGHTCSEWGFFQVVDHEVPPKLLHRVKKVAKQFFTQPLEEKRRIGRSFDHHLGYNDSELTKNTRDWKEIFDWAFQGYMEMPETVESDYRFISPPRTFILTCNCLLLSVFPRLL